MIFPRELFADVGLRASISFVARLITRFERLTVAGQPLLSQVDLHKHDVVINAAWSFARALPEPPDFRDLGRRISASQRPSQLRINDGFFDTLVLQTARAVHLSYDAAWSFPPPEEAVVTAINAIGEVFAPAVSSGSAAIRGEMAHDIEALNRLSSRGKVKIGGQVEPGQTGPFGPLWNVLDSLTLAPWPKQRPYLVMEACKPLTPSAILSRRTDEGSEDDAIWIIYFAKNEESPQVENIRKSARLYHRSKPIQTLQGRRTRNDASVQELIHSDPYFVLYVSDASSDNIHEFRDSLLRDRVTLITGTEIRSSRLTGNNIVALKDSLPRDLRSLKAWFENELNTVGIARDRGGEGEVKALLRSSPNHDAVYRDLPARYPTQSQMYQPS